MKKIILLLFVLLFVSISFAQETKKDDWIRVQSDDGEFSIEVPANYSYFYDKDGFSVSKDTSIYSLKNMNMLNVYVDDTLLSFECYQAQKDALDTIRERDENGSKFSKEKTFSEEIKKDSYKIKQLTSQGKYAFTIKQYFYSKSSIYLLVASSRNGETQTMRHFLDSLQFKPNSKFEQIKDAIVFLS